VGRNDQLASTHFTQTRAARSGPVAGVDESASLISETKNRSRNTRENALNAVQLIKPEPGERTLNNWLTYHDRRLTGWRFVRGLLSFVSICGFGAVANVGIATLLFSRQRTLWWVAGTAGAAMSLVWNYAVTLTLTWQAR
jgi:GtrA-like protein